VSDLSRPQSMSNTCGRTVHRGVMDVGLTAVCLMVLVWFFELPGFYRADRCELIQSRR
jgi:hypothetical protein